MTTQSVCDELEGLRQFLVALEDGGTTLTRGGFDMKPREVGVLKKEIKHLEGVLSPARSGGV